MRFQLFRIAPSGERRILSIHTLPQCGDPRRRNAGCLRVHRVVLQPAAHAHEQRHAVDFETRQQDLQEAGVWETGGTSPLCSAGARI